jgi:sporulation protein YlmC with PRC-barrel domain
MNYTDIGSKAGLIYDVDEDIRLGNFANKLNKETNKADIEESKKKDIIRYTIISIGAILILVAVQFLVKKRK